MTGLGGVGRCGGSFAPGRTTVNDSLEPAGAAELTTALATEIDVLGHVNVIFKNAILDETALFMSAAILGRPSA